MCDAATAATLKELVKKGTFSIECSEADGYPRPTPN